MKASSQAALLSGLLSLLGCRTHTGTALLLFRSEHVHRTQRQLRILLSKGDFLTKTQTQDKSARCTQHDPFFSAAMKAACCASALDLISA